MVTENGINFKHLEEMIFKAVCAAGCGMLREILEKMDEQLEQDRDRTLYRHKGRRKTAIKTLMGTVEYSRAVYAVKDGAAGQKHIYLLDKKIQRETFGLVSEALAENIVGSCCEMPYRKASAAVSGMTGQPISHTGAWRIVQAVGAHIGRKEDAAGAAAKQGQGSGRHESKVLFEEQDGVWLKLQGNDRKRYGGSKEMKLAIAYDGAKKRGKKRYELQNKVACANFEEAEAFFTRKEGVIADYYAVDEIETRILGGDGASWIRRSQTDETVHCQLDTFHRNKAVTRAVKHKGARREIFRLLYEKQIPQALEFIGILADGVTEEAERQGLMDLRQYLQNNEDGLVGYHRRGLLIPEAPEGMEYRRLGAMESNVFSLVGFRMKGRRAAWSIQGGNNMARLLCLKVTGRLRESLRNIAETILPPEYRSEVTTVLSAHSVKERIGRGYNGFHHFAPQQSKHNTWLHDLLSQKSFSSIRLQ